MTTRVILIFLFFLTPFFVNAAEIEIKPKYLIQGEPVLITVSGINALSEIKSAYFGKQQLNFFLYKGKISALGAIDLVEGVGTSTVIVNLKNGNKISKDVFKNARPKVEAKIDIPEKLGGNTKAAVQKLVTNLIDEQAVVKKITEVVKPKPFWKENFRFPLANPVITDTYGYSRNTVGYLISHKGTDFRAKVGTPILSINRGIVRDNKTYPTFGRVVIVDHGFGLYSMYLHLSKVKVNIGELVLPGQVVGFSGDSGYVTGAHLHLTIRINGISIDPEKFFELFDVKI